MTGDTFLYSFGSLSTLKGMLFILLLNRENSNIQRYQNMYLEAVENAIRRENTRTDTSGFKTRSWITQSIKAEKTVEIQQLIQ